MTDTTTPPPTSAPAAVPHLSLADRAEVGRAARKAVKRSRLGDWAPSPDRDPIAILEAQETTRVPELVPVRHERMAVSPFTFFRGAAAVFAADLAGRPTTGLQVQLCGDAHLTNFGAFASPERSLVFDLNDFDETLPGPFEWDVKRLAASFEVASRSNGVDEPARRRIQLDLSAAYATSMRAFASMGQLDVWYDRVSAEDVVAMYGDEAGPVAVEALQRNIRKAQGKDRLKALRKLTTVVDGEPRFLSQPPLLVPARELMAPGNEERAMGAIRESLRRYRRSLQPDRRHLLEQYRFVDLARKVVGVGSVGTRCWVALLVGRDLDDPLFLQVKEAERSVLEPYLARSSYDHQGHRVVEGQRLMQSSSDIFLGWERVEGLDGRSHDYYFRQLWDWKFSADVDGMDASLLSLYAKLCAYTLARAHARSGDAVAIAAYLGNGRSMGEAMAQFAAAYADQNEVDHATFVQRFGAAPSPAS